MVGSYVPPSKKRPIEKNFSVTVNAIFNSALVFHNLRFLDDEIIFSIVSYPL